MKNWIAICLMIALFLSCAGCGGSSARTATAPAPSGAADQTPAETDAPAREPESEPRAAGEEAEAGDEAGSRVLVLFFSATGRTRGVAEKIAALTGADLAEIVPAQPYTAEDLNYSDRTTRASAEQNDPDARPEIGEEITLDGYTTLYLGYPIWWGQAPRILSTFAEGHDFTGITVIPFCTSGSSGIGQSDDTLAGQAGSGRWLQGRRFEADVSEETLRAWIEETEGTKMEKTLKLSIGDTEVSVAWEDNESVAALKELVKDEPLTVQLSMYGGFEQVGPLGTSLPSNDVQTTTTAGDIVLYAGDQIVIFYGSNEWAYTRLGRITDVSAEEITELLSNGGVVITLSVE